jgi:hypothetical protein
MKNLTITAAKMGLKKKSVPVINNDIESTGTALKLMGSGSGKASHRPSRVNLHIIFDQGIEENLVTPELLKHSQSFDEKVVHFNKSKPSFEVSPAVRITSYGQNSVGNLHNSKNQYQRRSFQVNQSFEFTIPQDDPGTVML